jgi:glycosyltransferase involved in cell wall biosynthesis
VINIKILHIISGNDDGGGANHVLNICKAPKKLYECEICCIGLGFLYDKANNLKVKTSLFQIKDAINGKLSKYINGNSFDIVNFHGAKANLINLFLKGKINAKSAATVHSDYRYDFLNNKLKYFLFTPLSKKGLKGFNNFICVSEYNKTLLVQNGFKGEKFVVGNGIDLKYEKQAETSAEIRNLYNISNNDFVFIMVARFHPIKNHKGLISAFKKLTDEFNDVKLMLVGEGDLKEDIQSIAEGYGLKNKVIFTGFKVNTEDYINASDISILTSFNEGGTPPLVILESGVVKKAVICSKVGDMEEFLSHDNGYLIDPNSVDNIYDEMKRAYLNRENVKLMGKNIFDFISKYYSVESFWERYYSIYHKILMKH